MMVTRDGDGGEAGGSPDAAQDLYGLGVRIGFYLQAMGMVLYTYGSGKDRGKGLKLASGSITIAILASWFVFSARGLFSPSEAAVVLLILLSLSFPAKTTLLNPHTIVAEAIGLVALLLVEMGTCAALLWLFARLVVTLPRLGTPNLVFLFCKVRLDGGFRWVALVYSIIDTTTSLKFAYKLLRVIGLALQQKAAAGTDDDHVVLKTAEEIIEWKELTVWIKCFHWLVWVLVVVAVELTARWNHLAPSTDLQSPGQLIPLVAGIIIFTDSSYVAGRERLPGAYAKISFAFPTAAAVSPEMNKPGMYLVTNRDGSMIDTFVTNEGIYGFSFRRRVFYVDRDNLLRCARFRPDREQWEDISLKNSDLLSVDMNSRLSGAFLADGHQLVFFESRRSHVSVIRVRDGDTGEWDALPSPPVELMPEGFHLVLVGQGGGTNLHFLYVHQDGAIHRSCLWNHAQGGTWEGKADEILPGTSFLDDEEIKKFIALPISDGQGASSLQFVILSKRGNLVRIESDGQKTKLRELQSRDSDNDFREALAVPECLRLHATLELIDEVSTMFGLKW
ncbi:hypothetical protein VTG60DRAFT_5949 [Thermothelomyces hinnuleus]